MAPVVAKEWRMASRVPFGLRREMAKRFGYIEPRGRGRWAIRFTIEGRIYRIASWQDPIGRKHAFRDEDTPTEILDEIRSDIRHGKDPLAAVAPYMPNDSILSVETLWAEFSRVQAARYDAGQLSKRRAEEIEGHLSRGKLEPIRDIPVPSLDFSHLESLQLDLFEKGRAPKTVHHVLADVRTFLRWCVRRGIIQSAPEIPVTQLVEYEPTIPSVEEQRARLAAIPEAARGYFLARGLLGIRHQEALRLEVGDYRRREGDDGERLDDLSIKGKGRRFRVLPAPAELAAWVRKHRPALAEAGTPLFTNPNTGRAWTQASLIRVWRAMEADLGLEHVKPNEALRHCFGTRTAERLIGEGMSRDEAQAAVMNVMGHTSKATSDRYVKLAAETLRGVIE